MKHTAVVSLVILVLVVSSGASAQVLQSFDDLALRVNLDDQVQVEDRSGEKISGRLSLLTRDEIAIQSDAGETRVARDAVRAVAVRGHALRRGALIGAGAFAILGVVATCTHEGGAGCAFIGVFGGAPIGAGLGLAVGALVPQLKPVYRAPEGGIAVQPSRPSGGVPGSLLEDLALRVNLEDRLRVEDQSGARITGRLTRLTAEEITLLTDAGEKQLRRESIRQVAVRRHPIRAAVLIGAGAGAALGAVAACTGQEREECADAPILAGAAGAGLGLVTGALIHRTTTVYPEARTRTSIGPVIWRDAVGVRVSRSW